MEWFPYMPMVSDKNSRKFKKTGTIETVQINQYYLKDHPYQPMGDQPTTSQTNRNKTEYPLKIWM